MAGFILRAAGFALGAAVGSLVGYLMWSPPPPHWQRMHIGPFIGYALTPLFIFFGIYWLADWAASHIDGRRLTKQG